MRPLPRRPVATTLVVVGALLLALPSAATTTTTEELDRAATALAQGEARLDAAVDAIEETDRRAARAAADLADVEDDLVAATAAAAAADEAAALAGATLADGIRALVDDEAAMATAQRTVDDRAAALFMRGSATDSALVVGVLGAGEVHDVLVRVQAVGRIAQRDAARLAASAHVVRERAVDRDARSRARNRATQATAQAVRARDEAAALVARQVGLVAEAARAAGDRRAALDALEADVAARAALVAGLQERLRAERLAEVDDWVADAVDVAPGAAPPAWASGLPARGRRAAPAIVHGAAHGGLDPRLLAAVVWTESGFDPAAVSPAGAVGLAQLMPGTAHELGVDPWDPLDNLRGGARYLRSQLDRFGRVDLALAAYNAGPGRVAAAGGIPDIVETQLYVLRVLERVEHLGGVGTG